MKIEMNETKEEALKFIEAGGQCTITYGWSWKGAYSRPITQGKALDLLPHHDFGECCDRLCWEIYKGEITLDFNILSEMDLD